MVRFCIDEGEAGQPETHLIDDYFVVVSDVSPAQIAAWFADPVTASEHMSGVRQTIPLWDPDGYFKAIQERALAVRWDMATQVKAEIWDSSQMVDWIEEVQKGLAGLRLGDEGRLLNARFGLLWGLVKVLRVLRGILISADNGSYSDVVQAVGNDSQWARLSRRSFGIEPGDSLRSQVRSGLRLYVLTVEMLADSLQAEVRKSIYETVDRIKRELGKSESLSTMNVQE